MKRKIISRIISENKMVNKLVKALSNSRLRSAMIIATIGLFACGPADTGDLTGLLNRRPWFHPQPPGTVYIPSGTFHTGQSGQDVFQSYLEPNKQMTIVAFWMDETEITNNEYRQFVDHVLDSIARYKLDDDQYFFPEDDEGNRFIDYSRPLDWEKHKEDLADLFYQGAERFRGLSQIDTRKLMYKYQWFDYVSAAATNTIPWIVQNSLRMKRR
jgi:formylglycine-generating enzyme required for sulfatase activity